MRAFLAGAARHGPRRRLCARAVEVRRHGASSSARATTAAARTARCDLAAWPRSVPSAEEVGKALPPDLLEEILNAQALGEIAEEDDEVPVLNPELWAGYRDLPSMAKATEKTEILSIFDSFVLARRRHIHVFSLLKREVLGSLDAWTAAELAPLLRAWAELNFLHEEALVAVAGRVAATAHLCGPAELTLLLDAYATLRCSVSSAVDAILAHSLYRLDDFSSSQLCLHASSLARLQHTGQETDLVLATLSTRLSSPPAGGSEDDLRARDYAIAAQGLADLGAHSPAAFAAIARGALALVDDLTAQDLASLAASLARARYRDADLLAAMAGCLQRKIAQFDAESLVLCLRALSFLGFDADGLQKAGLFARVVAQLPRAIASFRPDHVVALASLFAAERVHSAAFFDIVTPFMFERSCAFTAAHWAGVLRAWALLGHRDEMLLDVIRERLRPERLTPRQRCSVALDFARLSSPAAGAAFLVDEEGHCREGAKSLLALLGESSGDEASREAAVDRLLTRSGLL